ncbi:hypothetical protein NLG97_g3913 [Lecanicillium saksenae]|uniref:Uncharacterized protein n=1 Tax=Lecanicillium saksenae TaxID=468837 RepID=A0ACC1QWR9_9HYPO|nr:hypothetical protein NLG97_g3913 [Lecanicillium saksenae]
MSQYAAVHDWDALAGPGDSRPTASRIIQNFAAEGALASKVILITGVSSGIGAATATALARTGATIVGAGRSVSKAKAALSGIADYPHLHLLELDLTRSASIDKFAAEFLERFSGQLNILINNAGGVLASHALDEDGHERQFSMNYLGHFRLFSLLKDALLSSATAASPSRVINDDYVAFDSYCQSKTAMVYMASEIERRHGPENLHAWSLQPGAVLASSFLQNSGWDQATQDAMLQNWPAKYFKSNEQGAATQVWAAVSADVLRESARGKYLEDVAVSVPAADTKFPDILGYEKHTYDEKRAKELWSFTEELLGVKA